MGNIGGLKIGGWTIFRKVCTLQSFPPYGITAYMITGKSRKSCLLNKAKTRKAHIPSNT